MWGKLLLPAFSGRSAFCGEYVWKLSVWSRNEFPFRLPGLSIPGNFSGPSVIHLRWASWKKALQLDHKLGTPSLVQRDPILHCVLVAVGAVLRKFRGVDSNHLTCIVCLLLTGTLLSVVICA